MRLLPLSIQGYPQVLENKMTSFWKFAYAESFGMVTHQKKLLSCTFPVGFYLVDINAITFVSFKRVNQWIHNEVAQDNPKQAQKP